MRVAGRLAASAAGWARQLSITNAGRYLDAAPGLFVGRPVVLAHGDFAPVNVLTDGAKVTGLLDFEAVRLADPLLDAAWWAWSVSFSSRVVLEEAWPAFLDGAGIDAGEPGVFEPGSNTPGAAHARTARLRQPHTRHRAHRDGSVARDTRLTGTYRRRPY